jgi:hypothetical protein
MNVTKQSGGTVLGKVDASLYTIGGVPAAPDVRILDTDQGAYTAVSMQRLDGVQITSGETLYQEAENGKITALILKDVTGDNGAYGVVTRAQKTTTTDADGSSGVRGSYTYILEGAVRSLTTQNSSLGVVGTGPAKLTFSGETLVSMRNLRKTAGAVTSFTNTRLTCEGSSLVWGIAEKADVYELSDSNQYLHVTIQEALAAREAGRTVEFYYDDTPQNGGQIRILIIRS